VEEVVGQYVSLVEHVGDMADECNELSAVLERSANSRPRP
jgi:hypothetical protein